MQAMKRWSMAMLGCSLAVANGFVAAASPRIEFVGAAELYRAGEISKPDTDELFATSNPLTPLVLYGCDDCRGAQGKDIWITKLQRDRWTKPSRAKMDLPTDESLPSFSADGYWVYYVSTRRGGFGGSDLFRMHYTPRRPGFGAPENVGGGINSAGEEGAATANAHGLEVIFASAGRKGARGWDLFRSRREEGRMAAGKRLDSIDTSADEFDPSMLSDDVGLVFARSEDMASKPASLWFAPRKANGEFDEPVRLGDAVNAPGTSVRAGVQDLFAKDYLFFSRKSATDPAAKHDLYRIRYRVVRD
jgi:TolB protein